MTSEQKEIFRKLKSIVLEFGKKRTLIRTIGLNITKNVVISRHFIRVDGVKYDLLDYLKNHFPLKTINYNNEEMSVEKFITC